VVLCHRSGNESNKNGLKFKTLTIDVDSLADHLAHGDQIGVCP
jgi:hypothetical protein